MKQGYPLRAIDRFDPRMLATLRDVLSVTTAEEFLHATRVYPEQVARLLATDQASVHEYAEAAAAVLDSDEVEAILHPRHVMYPFHTGHDTPGAAGPGGMSSGRVHR